jgi:hypothetical protein
MQYFPQPPLAALPNILPHAGAITVEASWICVLVTEHLKTYAHKSAMQELNLECVVLTLCKVSVPRTY